MLRLFQSQHLPLHHCASLFPRLHQALLPVRRVRRQQPPRKNPKRRVLCPRMQQLQAARARCCCHLAIH